MKTTYLHRLAYYQWGLAHATYPRNIAWYKMKLAELEWLLICKKIER